MVMASLLLRGGVCNRPRPYVSFLYYYYTPLGALGCSSDLYLPRWVVERGRIVWERQHGLPAVLPLTTRSPYWETLVLSSIKKDSLLLLANKLFIHRWEIKRRLTIYELVPDFNLWITWISCTRIIRM